MAIFGREPPSVECMWGRQKSRFWANIWLYCQLSTLRPRLGVVNTPPPNGQTVTSCDTTAGSKRRRLLFTGDDDEVFVTRSLNVTPQTTEHLIVRSDKPVAYVTNDRRMRSTSVLLKLTTDSDRSIAWPLCDSRATCLPVDGTWRSRYTCQIECSLSVQRSLPHTLEKYWRGFKISKKNDHLTQTKPLSG